VQSAVLRFEVRAAPRFTLADEKQFFEVVDRAFSSRRKYLKNNLSFPKAGINGERICLSARVSPQARAEDLTLEQFAALARAWSEKG
jgi:16S rRNA (adenine1518-N6/adenine1519-N6)-dimethyltransferase